MFEPLVSLDWNLLVGHHSRLRVVVWVRGTSDIRLVSSARKLASDYFALHSLAFSLISIECFLAADLTDDSRAN